MKKNNFKYYKYKYQYQYNYKHILKKRNKYKY